MRSRWTVVLAGVVLAVLGTVSACGGPTTRTAGDGVPGDRRQVTEPQAPATTCATVDARLAMPDRQAGAADEAAPPDTVRIQQALDSCAQTGDGQVAVRLVAGAGPDLLSGPLTVRRGEVLLLDPGVVLFASRDAADYQVGGKPTCGTVAPTGGGCAPLLTLGGPHTGIESTPDAAGRQGRVDGRGDQTVLGGTESWWQLAADAKAGGQQEVPRLVQATGVDDVVLHDVDLVDSPGFHVSLADGDGFTAWGVRIATPATARNTDGIDPAGATDVTIADSWIADGDDGIAITAGSRPSAHITVEGDHLDGTHGISIGSGTTAGVRDVLVTDDTVSGTDPWGTPSASSTGIRIKSSPAAGGTVSDVVYRDLCVDAVRAPIDLDPDYGDASGSTTPWFTGITVTGLRATDSPAGAASVLEGLDDDHPLGLALTAVSVDARAVTAAHARIALAGATFGGAPPSGGDGVDLTVGEADGAVPTCSFPAFLAG